MELYVDVGERVRGAPRSGTECDAPPCRPRGPTRCVGLAGSQYGRPLLGPEYEGQCPHLGRGSLSHCPRRDGPQQPVLIPIFRPPQSCGIFRTDNTLWSFFVYHHPPTENSAFPSEVPSRTEAGECPRTSSLRSAPGRIDAANRTPDAVADALLVRGAGGAAPCSPPSSPFQQE